ncbi:porin [Psychromonas ossibalaenae]|uniref:porin n=1 Tax=Psychromonas ossibalaenae TaxID=444922 RepID=UPI000477614C|nr:porin [Psychromonas ossibalaenae]
MKKTILAIAVTGLMAASAQAANVYDADGVSADVYGRMQFDISDTKNTTMSGVGTARLGINASSEIAPGIRGIAKGEWQIRAENSADDAKQLSARHVYAGFATDDYGQLVFGQTDTAFYQAVAATDIFNTYGYAAFANVEDGRQEGQIVYNGTFNNFYVGASAQFADDNFKYDLGNPDSGVPAHTTGEKLDNSYAVTLGYTADFGLSVYGGYHAQDFKDANKNNYALSAAYSREDLYLGAAYVWAELEKDGVTGESKVAGYDLVASYALDAVSLYGGYAFQEAKGNISGDKADEFTLGVAYKFNSNMKAWAEYNIDQLDGADDAWTVAVQYNF